MLERHRTQSEASQGYPTRRYIFMFIKLGDYVIAINQIAFIKRIGAGCEVYLKDCAVNVIKVATVSDNEYDNAIMKLFST
jgi:hypothetical protein